MEEEKVRKRGVAPQIPAFSASVDRRLVESGKTSTQNGASDDTNHIDTHSKRLDQIISLDLQSPSAHAQSLNLITNEKFFNGSVTKSNGMPCSSDTLNVHLISQTGDTITSQHGDSATTAHAHALTAPATGHAKIVDNC